jgi:hypothetical protein
MDRAPGGHEAGTALKTVTTAALITDHERKAAATCIPNLDVLNGSNDPAELHTEPQAYGGQSLGLAQPSRA